MVCRIIIIIIIYNFYTDLVYVKFVVHNPWGVEDDQG